MKTPTATLLVLTACLQAVQATTVLARPAALAQPNAQFLTSSMGKVSENLALDGIARARATITALRPEGQTPELALYVGTLEDVSGLDSPFGGPGQRLPSLISFDLVRDASAAIYSLNLYGSQDTDFCGRNLHDTSDGWGIITQVSDVTRDIRGHNKGLTPITSTRRGSVNVDAGSFERVHQYHVSATIVDCKSNRHIETSMLPVEVFERGIDRSWAIDLHFIGTSRVDRQIATTGFNTPKRTAVAYVIADALSRAIKKHHASLMPAGEAVSLELPLQQRSNQRFVQAESASPVQSTTSGGTMMLQPSCQQITLFETTPIPCENFATRATPMIQTPPIYQIPRPSVSIQNRNSQVTMSPQVSANLARGEAAVIAGGSITRSVTGIHNVQETSETVTQPAATTNSTRLNQMSNSGHFTFQGGNFVTATQFNATRPSSSNFGMTMNANTLNSSTGNTGTMPMPFMSPGSIQWNTFGGSGGMMGMPPGMPTSMPSLPSMPSMRR